MSDSEDDFMSDKFLVEAAPREPQTYSARRSAAELKSMRAGQAKNLRTLKDEEEARRREGLNTSLFERYSGGEVASGGEKAKGSASGSGSGGGDGGSKAVDMMKKMGWNIGEGLGKRRSASPERISRSAAADRERGGENDNEEPARGGIGSSRSRAEPIRISMWAGRRGLAARSPTPPPLPDPRRDPDSLDPTKRARLDAETSSFRARRGGEFTARELERKQHKARDMLVSLDEEAGIKLHPLHVIPQDPLGMPRPLLRLIYPAQIPPSPTSPRSPSPPLLVSSTRQENMSAAERLRDRMRRDMLSDLGGVNGVGGDDEEEEGLVRFGRPAPAEAQPAAVGEDKGKYDGVEWKDMVSGAKKVLAMEPAEHLEFLVSQLRNEYCYCFWCSYKYSSWEEMNAPGGCPGEDEDDH